LCWLEQGEDEGHWVRDSIVGWTQHGSVVCRADMFIFFWWLR
jgi:hypothetical protein